MGAKDDSGISWRDSFLKQMKQIVENRWSAAEHTFADMPLPKDQRSNVTLTLYLVPGQNPVDLFSRVFEDQNVDTLKPNQRAEFTNTLIGLISQRPVNP
jgi:hypothetical protein